MPTYCAANEMEGGFYMMLILTLVKSDVIIFLEMLDPPQLKREQGDWKNMHGNVEMLNLKGVRLREFHKGKALGTTAPEK
jgi:hypothetical protein